MVVIVHSSIAAVGEPILAIIMPDRLWTGDTTGIGRRASGHPRRVGGADEYPVAFAATTSNTDVVLYTV